MFLKFTMPIYKQKKNGKRLLLGWNQLACLNKYTKNSIKQWYHREVINKLKGTISEVYKGKYRVEIVLFYKNVRCDLSNVCSVADKFSLDALQELGILKEDNVKHAVEVHYRLGGCDKENPRVEIELWRVD